MIAVQSFAMKRFKFLPNWLLAGLIAVSAASAGAQQFLASTPAGFKLKRGVNLSHWLSQAEGWPSRDRFITEKDIAFIASIGYDHVRIPIDEAEMWNTDGKAIEESMACLTHCLDWCGQYHLRAIVDLHILRAHYFNAENEGGPRNSLWSDPLAQSNFVRLWTDLSKRLRRYPVDQVAYQLMNEPVAPDAEDWNKLVAKTMASLRASEPNRVMVIGANLWQTPSSFPHLEVPAGDQNIILSCTRMRHVLHFITRRVGRRSRHTPDRCNIPACRCRRRTWTSTAKTNGANPEVRGAIAEARQVFDKQALVQLLQPAIQRARDLKLPLYCGEFGCLPRVDPAQRLRYYDDIISAFEENHIAWCNWEYKGDFGIRKFDAASKASFEPDLALIHVMMRERQRNSGI